MAIYDENGNKVTAHVPKSQHGQWLTRVVMAALVTMLALYTFQGSPTAGREVEEDLSSYLSNVKRLTIVNEGHSMSFVRYARFESMRYSTMERKVVPVFTKSDDGSEVTMRFDNSKGRMVSFSVLGPSLEAIEVKGPMDVELYNGGNSIDIINEGSDLSLVSGADRVSIVNGQSSTIRLDKASIENLEIKRNDGLITASSVASLKVDAAHECVDRSHWAFETTMIKSVTSGKMTFAGVEQPAGSLVDNCGRRLIIGPVVNEE